MNTPFIFSRNQLRSLGDLLGRAQGRCRSPLPHSHNTNHMARHCPSQDKRSLLDTEFPEDRGPALFISQARGPGTEPGSKKILSECLQNQ